MQSHYARYTLLRQLIYDRKGQLVIDNVHVGDIGTRVLEQPAELMASAERVNGGQRITHSQWKETRAVYVVAPRGKVAAIGRRNVVWVLHGEVNHFVSAFGEKLPGMKQNRL